MTKKMDIAKVKVLNFDRDLQKRIDRFYASLTIRPTRSEVIRHLIRLGLRKVGF